MLKPLFKFEEGLLRVERWVLVGCVMAMLLLAAYTVFYRNVLIPWQNHLMTSGPPVVAQAVDEPERDEEPADVEVGAEDFAGGFGGGFGEEEPAEDEADQNEADEDEAGGFGGGFGEEAGDEEADGPAKAEPERAEAEPDEPAEPMGGPPEEGSWGALVVALINELKFHWIDVLLRQLVIISGFLGAMMATRQRNHITIDAVGTLLKGRLEHVVQMMTGLVAAIVCVFLALSGWDLVEIGLEYPRNLIPWVKEWHFQLAFPLGWGLLAFHFLMRTIESAQRTIDYEKGEPEEGGNQQGETPPGEAA